MLFIYSIYLSIIIIIIIILFSLGFLRAEALLLDPRCCLHLKYLLATSNSEKGNWFSFVF